MRVWKEVTGMLVPEPVSRERETAVAAGGGSVPRGRIALTCQVTALGDARVAPGVIVCDADHGAILDCCSEHRMGASDHVPASLPGVFTQTLMDTHFQPCFFFFKGELFHDILPTTLT